MAFEFTDQQNKVLNARGHNVLVSAAAGSGKTAVLVERIIREISEPGPHGEQPLDIDRLLVVTFTRAAAAQMREKIARAVSKRLEEDPENRHLQRQETLLHHAQITTIDSFCTFLLRNNFSEIGLDPGFRQMDETENTLLENDVMQRFLEGRYAQKDPEFLDCVNYFCPGSSDSALENLILRLYRTADSHPYPEAWLEEHSHDYEVRNADELMHQSWYRNLLEEQAEGLGEIRGLHEAMIRIAGEPDGPFPYLDVLEREKEGLFREWLQDMDRKAAKGKETDPAALREKLLQAAAYPLERFPVIRNAEKQGINTGKKEQVQALRKQEKARLDSIKDLLLEDPELTVSRMKKAEAPLRTLAQLTIRYMEALSEEKRNRNVISFSDLEHDALGILIDRSEDGTLTERKAAEEYRHHFAEILIDEYQDSNEVQELLLRAVAGESLRPDDQEREEGRSLSPEASGKGPDSDNPEPEGERNRQSEPVESMQNGTGDVRYARFMVGDVKQSIYRFRNARPEIFQKKFETYKVLHGAEEAVDRKERIDLDQNFRSRREVLDAVNDIFMKIMRREVGGVEYDETVSLKPGASYPDPVPGRDGRDPYQTELLIVDGAETEEADDRSKDGNNDASDDIEDEIAELSNHKKEALAVAQRIRELVGKLPVTDPDTGEQRMARYGDIVILLRSTSGRQDAFREIFEKEGIPLYLEYKGGYFSAEEVRQILQVLRVIDNPRQDIPLYGALRGYFGGFSEDEIGQIRAVSPDRNLLLYDCLLTVAGRGGNSADDTESDSCSGHTGGTADNRNYSDAYSSSSVSAVLGTKCREFLDWLDSWREQVRTTPIHDLIGELIRSTGYEDYVRALPSGQRRAANLHSLLVKAAAFEQTDYAGLFRFLRYIDQMHEFDVDYGEAGILDEHADVVRLTTIHKSKGLEYPICFVCGLGARHPFARDLSGILITDSDMGIGVNYVDTDLRSQTQTLRQKAVADKIGRDALGEELRVLYVAMTRAKEKLILTGFVRDSAKFGKGIETQMAAVSLPARHLPVSMIRGASGYLSLIMEGLTAVRADRADPSGTEGADGMRGKDPVIVVRVPVSDLALSKVEDQESQRHMKETLILLENGGVERLPVPALAEKLRERFAWRYPYENMTGLFTKTTVSELKHAAMVDAGILEEDRAPEGPEELYPDRDYAGSDNLPVPRFAEAADDLSVMPEDTERAERSSQDHVGDNTGRPQTVNPGVHNSAGAATAGGISSAEPKDAGRLSGAARGTAIHRMCELIDYHVWKDPARVTAQEFSDTVNVLAGKGTIAPESVPALTPRVFLPFLKSDIAARMAAADQKGFLRREQPFVLGIAANRLKPDFPPEETILIQGIIDAFFIEENSVRRDGVPDHQNAESIDHAEKRIPDEQAGDHAGEGGSRSGRHIVLVDYKTDRVRTPQQLVERYQVQLDYYAEALEKMLGLPVTEKIIYSFHLQQEIRVR